MTCIPRRLCLRMRRGGCSRPSLPCQQVRTNLFPPMLPATLTSQRTFFQVNLAYVMDATCGFGGRGHRGKPAGRQPATTLTPTDGSNIVMATIGQGSVRNKQEIVILSSEGWRLPSAEILRCVLRMTGEKTRRLFIDQSIFMMHSSVSNLTAALLALHTVLGCCWHHAHRCTETCVCVASAACRRRSCTRLQYAGWRPQSGTSRPARLSGHRLCFRGLF